jgi:hypothetical protein
MVEAIAYFFASGTLEEAGERTDTIQEIYPMQPTLGPDWMEGQILFIDQFIAFYIMLFQTKKASLV